MNAQAEAIRTLVETHIVFSLLSEQDKRGVEGLFEVATYPEGSVICEQGQPMDGMYVVHLGAVRLKQLVQGKRVSRGELGPGGSVGEESLIQEAEWQEQVVASVPTQMFWLSAQKAQALQRANHHLTGIFTSQMAKLKVGTLVRGLLEGIQCDPHVFSDIVHALGVKPKPKGSWLFKQGEHDPRLYLIESGVVDLVRQTAVGEEVMLDRVRTLGLLGETAALNESGSAGKHLHSAKAVTDIVVYVIYTPEVQKILELNPRLHSQLVERLAYFKDQEKSETQARSRAEGVDQRIKLTDAVTEADFLALKEKPTKKSSGFATVAQGDESDCGAACLTMISKHYGKHFSMAQIRELSNLSTSVTTPNSIINGAELLGFSAKGYAIPYDELRKLELPGIIGWESYHYAVLFEVGKNSVRIADPNGGKIKKLSREEFIQGWTAAEVPGVENKNDCGVFISLEPTKRFEKQYVPEKPIWHFVEYLLPHKAYFGEALLAALAINLLGLASPLFIQNIVDTVVVHADVNLLNMMLGGMVLVAVMTSGITITQNILLAYTTARIDMRLMSEFYRHILSLPISFFLTRNKGDILARFGENSKIRGIIAGSSITVILNTLMVILYFGMMFAYSKALAPIVLFFVPFYVAIPLYFTPKMKQINQQIYMAGSQAQSYLIESLNGIEALKATSNEYMARSRWENVFVDNVNKMFASQRLGLTSQTLFQILGLAMTVCVLGVGANQVMAGQMTVGELMGFNMLMGLVISPVQQMIGLWNNLQEVRISVDRVGEVLNVKPEQEPITTPEAMPAVLTTTDGAIKFKDVYFSYVLGGKENHIMRGFNLDIEPGMRVGFVGPSGCGKSTVAKMVLGFNMPQRGECLISGKSVSALDLSSLRRNIGVVLQDSFLFSGTVAENIALGDPEPDMEAVREAARLAGADDFIRQYALQYQTPVGEKGMGVSGGQRQRICIARALYRRPKIMIFDEATSALDNESEMRIQENIDNIIKGRTSITIAHRLSTIRNSDMICFIHDGKVQEKGTHDQLTDPDYLREMGYKGMYYQLAEKQFGLKPLSL